MIRCVLYRPGTGAVEHGGSELLDIWAHDQESIIWTDLYENDAEEETRLMIEHFDLNPLAIQDAQRSRHPPKIEAFDGVTFMLFKGLHGEASDLTFRTIQLALFVGGRFLVTRHSGPSPSIEQLGGEITRQDSPIAQGADVLALRLLRIMSDRYLNLILTIEPRLEQIEDEMIKNPHDELLAELINYKTNLKKYTRVFLYHVQVISELQRRRFPSIGADQNHLVTDVYEQQERASSLGRLYYETAADLIDGYISVASHRLNNIMKILTIVTAIFVPLSFLAGIYGMNFEYMPELKSQAGYFVLLGIMGSMVAVLLYVFRKKKWL